MNDFLTDERRALLDFILVIVFFVTVFVVPVAVAAFIGLWLVNR